MAHKVKITILQKKLFLPSVLYTPQDTTWILSWWEHGFQFVKLPRITFDIALCILCIQLLLLWWVESKRWVNFFNPYSQLMEWEHSLKNRIGE
jgi:hypothetical protein